MPPRLNQEHLLVSCKILLKRPTEKMDVKKSSLADDADNSGTLHPATLAS